MLRGARELAAFLREPLSLDPKRLRRLAELRHAGAWLVDRVRLEVERKVTFDGGRRASMMT